MRANLAIDKPADDNVGLTVWPGRARHWALGVSGESGCNRLCELVADGFLLAPAPLALKHGREPFCGKLGGGRELVDKHDAIGLPHREPRGVR